MAQDQEGGTTGGRVEESKKMETSPVKGPKVDAATAGQPEASSTSSVVSPEKADDKLSKAQNALIQGKRHFLMKDTAHACSALGDACKLLTELYGPIASEHAEAHFFYGRTLLDLARAELSIFEAPPANGAEKGEEEGDEDDTEGSDEEENEDEDEKKNGNDDGKNGNEDEEEEEETKKVKSEGEEEEDAKVGATTEEDLNVPSPAPGPSASSTAVGVDDEKPSTSAGPKVDGAEPDDLSNLELAWEVLEIAKIGFTKQIEELEAKLKDEKLLVADRETVDETLKQTRRRLAETNSVLGEVSTESESYPQAVEDFKTALAMYSELESADSREIAQVHFHVGVAHGLAKEFQKSIQSFNRSVEILRERMNNLKKSLLTAEDPTAKEQLEKEIAELTELLPELEERINDTLEQEKEASKVEAEEKMEEEIIQRNSPIKNPNPPAANDISHLVKKRKKTEEPAATTETEQPPSKKACTNLAFDSAPPVNGHSKVEPPAEVTPSKNGE